MSKSAIRLLALTVCAAFGVISATPSANAAASGVEMAKSKKKIQNNSIGESRPVSPTWPPPMYDDFDRKNAGGGGGM
jgi:hypothetical protein